MADPGVAKRIVVGVDGSSASRDALRWALEEARLWHGAIEAVHAWSYPVTTYAPGVVPPPTFAREDLETEARHVLNATIDAVVGDEAPGLPLERAVVEGSAAKQLIERARHADMLVVGHRGRGGFTGLLLGSVAEQCAVHASCPSVITRPQAKAAGPGRPTRIVVGVDPGEGQPGRVTGGVGAAVRHPRSRVLRGAGRADAEPQAAPARDQRALPGRHRVALPPLSHRSTTRAPAARTSSSALSPSPG